MVVIGLTQQVSTDAELIALTGMVRNHFVYHNGLSQLYIYEPNYGQGAFESVDGGFWIKENLILLNLQEYVDYAVALVEERTLNRIRQGFWHNGLMFSMTANAQSDIIGLNSTRDILTYPLAYSTIGGLEVYQVLDAAELNSMFLTALGTKQYHVDMGSVVIQSIRDAVNEVEIKAIIDLL